MENKIIIIAGPSGSGKTTLSLKVTESIKTLDLAISACTRDKRGRTEENGKDYYFMSPAEFKKIIDEEGFIEWEEVYQGSFYGTLKSELQRIWNDNKYPILVLDVIGAVNLKEKYKDTVLTIFIDVPIDELEKRLLLRGTETKESLSPRLYKINFEKTFKDKFDEIIINMDIEQSLLVCSTKIKKFLNLNE